MTKAPVVVRSRPHTAPSRSRTIAPLPKGLITPSTPDTERSIREPKANNIELIRQSILEGCSIKAKGPTSRDSEREGPYSAHTGV